MSGQFSGGAAAVLALMLAAAPAFGTEPTGGAPILLAQAEETPFLLRLFGFKKQEPAPPPGGAKIFRVPPNGAPQGGAAASQDRTGAKRITVPKPEVVIAPKDADSRRILVIGDQLAETLTRGLEVAFADTPKVRIDGIAVENSGVVSNSPVDWVARVSENLSGAAPADAVVVMLGLGEMKPIPVDGVEAEFRMEAWERVYRARIRALLLAARSRNIPVFVVGLVPMADIDLTTDIAYLDDLYRQEAQASFTTYVNIWNEFADETGSFTASGPDVGGQTRQLRLKDGVGFTRSGSRKLAFYVEQEIRAWVERGSPGLVMPELSGDGLVMSLTDPEVGFDEDLAGPATLAPPKDGTPLHDLVVLGLPLVPVTGRVDDLSIR
ncbi:MAG TPA: DUF459 domain-containing protein [Methylomirabilota bacterium]|nr:DUF459 domain-containing protein [Methylomirabilota bacterium]